MCYFLTSSFGLLCTERVWYANVFMLPLRQGSADNMLSLLYEWDIRRFLRNVYNCFALGLFKILLSI